MKFRFLLSTLCQVVQIAEDEAGLVDLSSLEDELKVRETKKQEQSSTFLTTNLLKLY